MPTPIPIPIVGQSTDCAIQRLNGLANLAAASRPVITTEIGWDENQGFAQADVAKYALDAALDGIKDGDVKTYFYGLFDDGSGQFGLMNADGTPKPAGTAIHNLTTLLADTGADRHDIHPRLAHFTLERQPRRSDNTLVMQKSDGSFWLSLWNENDAAHNVTISLPTAAQVHVFDPLTGIQAVSGRLTNAVTVSVPDHPITCGDPAIGNSSSAGLRQCAYCRRRPAICDHRRGGGRRERR